MARLVAMLMGVALLAAGVAAAQELTSSPDDDPTVSVGTSTEDGTTTVDGTTTADGTTTVDGTTTDDGTTTVRREAGEDVRGPCDEAEHANDPRCTGTAGAEDDRGGRGRGDDDDRANDNDDEDRSGSNSGRG